MPRDAFLRSPYYNEWCRPSGNLDSAGISATSAARGGAESLMLVTSARTDQFESGGREETLLGLLQPAFAAAIGMLALARSWRHALGSALNLAGSPLALVQPTGELLHATPALLALVAAHPTAGALLAVAQQLGRDMGSFLSGAPDGALPSPRRFVRAEDGQYELQATLVQTSGLGSGPIVLVAVKAPAALTPSAAALAARFRLTPREAEVALKLARGERDRAIAQALGISHNTVRRHVEHVLAKVGVHTRAGLAARLLA
jgi:DNA-binding CsgD family transcriptional regulator